MTAADTSKRARRTRNQAYRDALAIQSLVTQDAKSESCTPRERCLLARAFKELEELKLRLKMKPAPKPVDVSVPIRNGRARAAAEFHEQPASPKPQVKPDAA